MGIVEDVLKALERLPSWKRIMQSPDEITALRARVEALEQRLAPATGDACSKCRAPTFMLERSEPDPVMRDLGVQADHYRCTTCGYTDRRTRAA